METILHFKRILSAINLLALAIRRTHILRFTTHSWRQLGKLKAVMNRAANTRYNCNALLCTRYICSNFNPELITF